MEKIKEIYNGKRSEGSLFFFVRACQTEADKTEHHQYFHYVVKINEINFLSYRFFLS